MLAGGYNLSYHGQAEVKRNSHGFGGRKEREESGIITDHEKQQVYEEMEI